MQLLPSAPASPGKKTITSPYNFHIHPINHQQKNPPSADCSHQFPPIDHDMGISKNRGTPNSSILIGFSIIDHPFWGVSPLFLG